MNEANRIKLRDFIRSLPPSYVGRATSIVCGSLVMTCTDRDLDEAIEVAMDQIRDTWRTQT